VPYTVASSCDWLPPRKGPVHVAGGSGQDRSRAVRRENLTLFRFPGRWSVQEVAIKSTAYPVFSQGTSFSEPAAVLAGAGYLHASARCTTRLVECLRLLQGAASESGRIRISQWKVASRAWAESGIGQKQRAISCEVSTMQLSVSREIGHAHVWSQNGARARPSCKAGEISLGGAPGPEAGCGSQA